MYNRIVELENGITAMKEFVALTLAGDDVALDAWWKANPSKADYIAKVCQQKAKEEYDKRRANMTPEQKAAEDAASEADFALLTGGI